MILHLLLLLPLLLLLLLLFLLLLHVLLHVLVHVLQVNVCGLVLAGSADFKNDLALSDMFDQRLQAKILKIVDVSYGGDNGFNQAIELASET